MPTTLEDIARALNVSKMTVSRAINNHPEISREAAAELLLELIDGKNCTPILKNHRASRTRRPALVRCD
jgi:hypothetical protein